jgi:hypothetical protein
MHIPWSPTFEYWKENLLMPWRYFNILFIAFKCNNLRSYINWLIVPIAMVMSGLVVIMTYIMLLTTYLQGIFAISLGFFWFVGLAWSVNMVTMLNVVFTCLHISMVNRFRMFLMYVVWFKLIVFNLWSFRMWIPKQ